MHVPVALALDAHPPVHLVRVAPFLAAHCVVLVNTAAVLILPGTVLVPIVERRVSMTDAVVVVYILMHGGVGYSRVDIFLKNVLGGLEDLRVFFDFLIISLVFLNNGADIEV